MSIRPESSNTTESIEDYLETILILSEEGKKVRSVDVAGYLGFTKPSVSHAVRLMLEDGLIGREANKYLYLTEKGLGIARETYSRHQFFESMLVDLGVDPAIAREDACRIEHIIHQESFDALVSFYLASKEERQ